MNPLDTLLTDIAQRHLRIEIHEVSVWELRDALEAAYRAGMEQGRRGKKRNASDG